VTEPLHPPTDVPLAFDDEVRDEPDPILGIADDDEVPVDPDDEIAFDDAGITQSQAAPTVDFQKHIDRVKDISQFIPDPEATPEPSVAEILPQDFPLPRLIRFVPDHRLKIALDVAVETALAIEVGSDEGLVAADVALARVRETIRTTVEHFSDAAEIANALHKGITSKRAEWTKPGDDCVKIVGDRIASEIRRLEAIKAAERREAQRLADAAAREEARKKAEAAQAQAAPPHVVERLQEVARTTAAPPLPQQTYAPPRLANTSVVKTWKARIQGTPGDADQNPAMADLTPDQMERIKELMQAAWSGSQAMTLFEINWKALNDRAKSDKGTFNIPGVESYEDTGTRGKGRR
jgi:hypothetical protein